MIIKQYLHWLTENVPYWARELNEAFWNKEKEKEKDTEKSVEDRGLWDYEESVPFLSWFPTHHEDTHYAPFVSILLLGERCW